MHAEGLPIILLWLGLCFGVCSSCVVTLSRQVRYGRRKDEAKSAISCVAQAKPAWVGREILKLKALMPEAGCRLLAHMFNRRYGKSGMTVGKTYVHMLIRKHQYEIQALRKRIREKPPRPVPRNLIWGMDLTGKSDSTGRVHMLLGIIEHHSRACLGLVALKDKCSITLLRALLELIERYGAPSAIRTDNETVFCSRLFRFGLAWLGIRHQRTDRACPWQNGRVERLFGTLKGKLDQWDVGGGEELSRAVHLFRVWYNHVRPHSALGGCTPAEVWAGKRHRPGRFRHPLWFAAWDGLLVGDYWLLE